MPSKSLGKIYKLKLFESKPGALGGKSAGNKPRNQTKPNGYALLAAKLNAEAKEKERERKRERKPEIITKVWLFLMVLPDELACTGCTACRVLFVLFVRLYVCTAVLFVAL